MDEAAAERLFRHKVLGFLRRSGRLSQERIDLLNSWRRSGFSVHNRAVVYPRDGREFEALVRYMMRPPVSLSRLHFTPGSHEVAYLPKREGGAAWSVQRGCILGCLVQRGGLGGGGEVWLMSDSLPLVRKRR